MMGGWRWEGEVGGEVGGDLYRRGSEAMYVKRNRRKSGDK
jgi:hypothetical protein